MVNMYVGNLENKYVRKYFMYYLKLYLNSFLVVN